MTVGQYITTSGTVGATVQFTLDQFDSFITGGLGWERVDVITNTGTDNDRVWRSEGEVPGKYMPLYFRARANSSKTTFYIYTFWDPDLQTGNDELAEASVEIHVPFGTINDSYVFAGNKDVVYFSVLLDSSGKNYLGGGGYWDTFYTPIEDPYPAFVFGQNNTDDTFSNTSRVRSYGFDPAGFLAPSSTYSGGVVVYNALDRNVLTKAATPNIRDNRHLMVKQDFYTQRSRTDGDIPANLSHEIRGEMPGLYQFHGLNFAPFERVVASGISVGDAVPGNQVGLGDWFVLKSSVDNTYAIGPTTNWNDPPTDISNLETWLRAGAHHLEYGGTVRSLVDLSENINHAEQLSVPLQPTPIASEPLHGNSPTLFFDDNPYISGAMTYVDGYTVFMVADYAPGTGTKPLFYVRGDVGGADTFLSIEFNTTVSGSVEVISQTSAAPSEFDHERQSGLLSTTPYVISAVVSGTTTTLYVNGDSNPSTTISDTRVTTAGSTELNYVIGADMSSAGSVTSGRHTGNISEVVVFARDLTTEEHQSVVCYLGDRYGVTVSGTCP